ncbi:MAG: hypothetical protein IJS32_04835 [Kiritimatiellae bacterium]|nr:hypothetical protein [Kiritimatiellia bacterium]
MKRFSVFAFFACAGASALVLSACTDDGDSSGAENTLSPAGLYTVSRAVSLAPVAAASTNEAGDEAESEAEAGTVDSSPAAGSVFTLSASPTSSGFDLSFAMADGTTFTASSSAAAIGPPSGTHKSFRPGDTIATFSLTGPVQGEITVLATARIDSDVSGGTSTNLSTNAVPSAVTTNVGFSASSSSAVSPGNSTRSANLTFPSWQLSATAPGPSGTISW